MDEALRRRLTILVMILVVVTVLPTVRIDSLAAWSSAIVSRLGLSINARTESLALLVSIWVVLMTMLALIPLRLLQSRPSGVNLWRQPGWLACNAVALALAVATIRQFATIGIGFVQQATLGFSDYARIYLLSLAHQATSEATIAVAAAWTTLALVGCWEKGEGWVDRLGYYCGIYVLAFPVVACIVTVLALA